MYMYKQPDAGARDQALDAAEPQLEPVALVQLIATVTLALSTLIVATAVSIGLARADVRRRCRGQMPPGCRRGLVALWLVGWPAGRRHGAPPAALTRRWIAPRCRAVAEAGPRGAASLALAISPARQSRAARAESILISSSNPASQRAPCTALRTRLTHARKAPGRHLIMFALFETLLRPTDTPEHPEPPAGLHRVLLAFRPPGEMAVRRPVRDRDAAWR